MNKSSFKGGFCAKVGMTKRSAHGFTLIELLVVVLIIGLLAAVALPQYNKAVKKAQGREVLVAVNALDKELHAYYLENGSYEAFDMEKASISLPELKYFTGHVSSGSEYFSAQFDFPSLQIGYVDASWVAGSLKRVACEYVPGGACADYFDCSEWLQLGSPKQSEYWCNPLGGVVRMPGR